MLSNTTIAFVGAGSMAEAMIGGLIEQKRVAPAAIIASGPRAERRQALAQKYGVRVTASNREAVDGAGVVVLSIKPQMLGTVAAELHGRIPPGALVLHPSGVVHAMRTHEEPLLAVYTWTGEDVRTPSVYA